MPPDVGDVASIWVTKYHCFPFLQFNILLFIVCCDTLLYLELDINDRTEKKNKCIAFVSNTDEEDV